MFRKLAAGSLCAILAWTASAAAGDSTKVFDPDDFVLDPSVVVSQGLIGFNDDLQQLRDIRKIARDGKKYPEDTLSYFRTIGNVYRDSGFPEIGRTFKRIAPLLSHALRGPTKKGKTVSRARARSATRQLVQALAENQRVLPEFRRSYESGGILSFIGAKTYPNYTGLALFFASKLDRILGRAAKGHKITRNLGTVPRKLWMTVRTDYDGESLTAFNGPLVAQNTIWFGNAGTMDTTSIYSAAITVNGAGAITYSVSLRQSGYNTYSGGTLVFAATSETQLVALPPGEEVPGMSKVISGTISGVEIPDGYTIHFVPVGSELPPDAIILAAPGQSVTFE